MILGFYPVDDTRRSVWVTETDAGRRWFAAHRDDPTPIVLPEIPPDPE